MEGTRSVDAGLLMESARQASAGVPVPGADEIAGGISKLGLYYIIGLLVLAVVALTGRLLWVESNRRSEMKDDLKDVTTIQDQRIADRDAFEARLAALGHEYQVTVADNAKAEWAAQRELMQLTAELRQLAADVKKDRT